MNLRRPTTSRRCQIDCVHSDDPHTDRARIDLEHLATWVDWMRNATRLPVIGYGRAGGATASSSRNSPLSAHHGWVCMQPMSPLRRRPALKWHDEAEKCRERIRRAISTGPGCTAVNHKPEQSVTDDPRWTEERALFDEAPDSPGPLGTVIMTSASDPATARDNRESR